MCKGIGKALRSALEYETPDDFAQRIFSKLQNISIPEMKEDDTIYVSFGAAFSEAGTTISFDQLYRNADSAMYHSKKNFGYYATIYENKKDMEAR